MQIHNPDFCKDSPNGKHSDAYLGDVERGGKWYKFYTCGFCGRDRFEAI